MKTQKTFEIEIMRSNVTAAEFLSYVRRTVDRKGGHWIRTDLDLRYFAAGNDLEFDIKGDPSKPCAAEKSVSRPYEMQTYILNWDGSVYNEICEFTFDDEKRGHGYYYLVSTEAAAEDAEANKREILEGIIRRAEDKINWNQRKRTMILGEIEREGTWMRSSYKAAQEREAAALLMENAALAEKIEECKAEINGGKKAAEVSSNKEAVKKYQSKLDEFKIRPSADEGKQIRQYAAAHGTSVQGLFLEAVREYIEKHTEG